MKEIWKNIIGYEGIYEVSNMGRIRREKEKIYCVLKNNKHGYIQKGLFKEGICKKYYVHILVALAFIKNPENKKEVNHINGIKSDNRLKNLEWVTPKENVMHAIKTGKLDFYYKNKSNNMKNYYKNTIGSTNRFKEHVKKMHEINKKKVINIETGEIFNSCGDISIITGIKTATIRAMLRGQNKNKTKFKYL